MKAPPLTLNAPMYTVIMVSVCKLANDMVHAVHFNPVSQNSNSDCIVDGALHIIVDWVHWTKEHVLNALHPLACISLLTIAFRIFLECRQECTAHTLDLFQVSYFYCTLVGKPRGDLLESPDYDHLTGLIKSYIVVGPASQTDCPLPCSIDNKLSYSSRVC